MTVRRLGIDDVDWAVARLAERRSLLVPFAPVYWRPAPNAADRHREFLRYLLGDGGAVGFRTDADLILAQPRDKGWVIDDAAVANDAWDGDGEALWQAVRGSLTGPVRWVCPVPEPTRLRFALAHGFETVESWWHWNVPEVVCAVRDGDPSVTGASAQLVPAPPVYAPGGPVLLLTGVENPRAAVADATQRAARLGSPVVVVSQLPGDEVLGVELENAGFRRHCDFLQGSA